MNTTVIKFWIIRIMMFSSLIPFVIAMGYLIWGTVTPTEFDTDYVSVILYLALFFGLFFGKDYFVGKWRNDFMVFDELQDRGSIID